MKYNEDIDVKEWNQKFHSYFIKCKTILKTEPLIEYHKSIGNMLDLIQNLYFCGFDNISFRFDAGSTGVSTSLETENLWDYEKEKPFYPVSESKVELDYENDIVFTQVTEDTILYCFNNSCRKVVLPREFESHLLYEMYCCLIEFYRFEI